MISWSVKSFGGSLLSQLLNGPVLLAKRASVVLLDPEAHAAVVERMVALAPNDDTLLQPFKIQ